MVTFLHIIWFTLPAIFIAIAIWSKLEALSGKPNRGEIRGYLKQAAFLLACAFIALGIESWFLEDFVISYLEPVVPLDLARIVLLPLVLLVAAKLLGGSKPIQLTSSRVSQERNRRR